MRLAKTLVLAALALCLAQASAIAAVKVTFVNPEHYTDLDRNRPWYQQDTLNQFQRTFEQLGATYLKPGQTLKLDVLDIDLAGYFEPWRFYGYDVRIMRDYTPPRFKVHYALEQKGRVILQADETITDLAYLMNPAGRLSSERLGYEKAMLKDWFRNRFGLMRPPPGV
ncbi:DUF3016 domain-containing protein [Beijerinckia indica]|uniref:DUF3016 domain-containing protein n=1 Tax=Beijerinckia indica subsp. indica (strain ATCC 9039 / DSM 1715 / NCIMB 8712) TaxID=395963 RepID=B2IF38_BEII9|nr:DUF3016 domain-containing protein [Beijerinckia indica]ACB95603.1 conserved hypothetical protein [Beijerinckia indica subsp. indica ATCC 9039]